MKRIGLILLCAALILSVTGCGVVRKYIPPKSCHAGSWLPDGITEDIFTTVNAKNPKNTGTYEEGRILFNASKTYKFPMSVFAFKGDVSGYSHIAFDITNLSSESLKKVSILFSASRTKTSSVGYTYIEPGESGVVLFPVGKFGDADITKILQLSLTVPDTENFRLSIGDIYPVNIEGTLQKTGCVIRDPFILIDNGTYYMYGTGWQYYKNTTGDINGEWTGPYGCVDSSTIPDYEKDPWAPEVYRYGDYYYMFTTYNSKNRGTTEEAHKFDGRGTVILRSDSPEGPFTMWSDGQITPDTWDAIDATLYVDGDGQPWLFFVHEWTSTDGGGGKFSCAKMSADLKSLITEPRDVFNAGGVTDGCFIYTAANGDLLSLWSTYDGDYGYCVNVIRSKNGIDGDWKFDGILYSSYYGEEGGGHGMIFTDTDGKMKLSFHIDSDNNYACFENIGEVNNRLVLSDLKINDLTK